jgi:hypothetical protein
MNSEQFLDQLTNEELRNASTREADDPSVIKTSIKTSLIGYMNRGLTDLHTRFLLKEKSLLLLTRVGISTYPIRPEYARKNGTFNGPRHIDDFNGEDFSDDFIKINGLYDYRGTAIPLNDTNCVHSAFTPEFDVIQIPAVFPSNFFSITYQVSHPLITEENLQDELEIPRFLEEPLKFYVAGKFFNHLNGEAHTLKGREYMAYYENACQKVVDKDMTGISEIPTNLKLEYRGFK